MPPSQPEQPLQSTPTQPQASSAVPVQTAPLPQQVTQQSQPMQPYATGSIPVVKKSLVELIKNPFVLVLLGGSLLTIVGALLKWFSFGTNADLSELAQEIVKDEAASKYTVLIVISLLVIAAALLSLAKRIRFILPFMLLVSVFGLFVVFNQRVESDFSDLFSNSVGWYLSLIGAFAQTVGVGLVIYVIFKIRSEEKSLHA